MRYPNLSRAAILECPVHGCSVALNDAGRIASPCPECFKEQTRARWRWAKRRFRQSTRSTDLSPTERAEAS